MEEFIFLIILIYVLGVIATVAYNALMWDDCKELTWMDEDGKVAKYHARQVLLAPFWPRYGWSFIKDIPPAVKDFFAKIVELIKDAR